VTGKATILKDGVYVPNIEGRIVRFNKGKTALMTVEKTELDAFGKRFYGINIIGDHHAAYAHNCSLPSKEDIEVWHSTQSDRNY